METVPAIYVNSVKKYFKDVKAVAGINLEIQPGEYVALLGPNGAGKTTLVEMIEGLQQPTSGEIRVNGMNWKQHAAQLREILGISLQETHFLEKIRVRETLNLFASFYNIGRERIETILDLVNLREKQRAFVSQLSGGQRQRLTLGVALLNNPSILLLDEPSTGLDPTARRELWNILLQLRKERNTTLILTTHYMEEATVLCERIIIMFDGKILAKGTLDELLSEHAGSEVIDFQIGGDLSRFDSKLVSGGQLLRWDEVSGKGQLMVDSITSYLPKLLSYVEDQGLSLSTLECRKMTLDDLFISMTGQHLGD